MCRCCLVQIQTLLYQWICTVATNIFLLEIQIVGIQLIHVTGFGPPHLHSKLVLEHVLAFRKKANAHLCARAILNVGSNEIHLNSGSFNNDHHNPVADVNTFSYPAGGGVCLNTIPTNKVVDYPSEGRKVGLVQVSANLFAAAKGVRKSMCDRLQQAKATGLELNRKAIGRLLNNSIQTPFVIVVAWKQPLAIVL
jgi:hypothetical protein